MEFQRLARRLRALACVLLASSMLTGCLATKAYVDPALPKLARNDLTAVAQPRPVQVLFEFRSKGNANAQATAITQPRVMNVVGASGLFASASAQAGAPDAGVLKIVIDNVPGDDAAAKGFGTGLTFGLAGSQVTDGYVCTVSYSRDGHTTETVLKHAIYTTIGNHSAPQGLQPTTIQDAVNQVVDQLTWNALKQLDDKHAFE